MAVSKSKKSGNPQVTEEFLKSDVASFASSIGLSSSLPSSGFDDSAFRKNGPLKPNKPAKSNPETRKNTNFRHQQNRKSNKKDNAETIRPGVSSIPASHPSEEHHRFKNLPKLPLMKASSFGVWYVDAEELEAKVVGRERKRVEFKSAEEWKALVSKKMELAERLLVQYIRDYESSMGRNGDIKMLLATQKSGTAADKVSAFSVLLGENPIANMRSLDALLAMVTSKVGKRHALDGFEALKELFSSSLLPDRKLKTLFQRPLDHLPESKDGNSLLLLWYWEDRLKQRYEHFIVALEEASRDVLLVLKDKALKILYALLSSKPEQERRLLSALVNKLGDPKKRGASNADFHLSNLLSDHPNMKSVVIDEVDSFLFRPHLGLRAKYYAVNFLSQIRLSHKGDGPKVAKRLVDVYFALFKVLMFEAGHDQKGEISSKVEHGKLYVSSKNRKGKSSIESHVEMDSRLLSALLTGVNRAFPFVSSDEADDVIEVQTPMLFQLVHSKNFNVGVQALMLLDKISSKNQIVSDRFYRALYSKLLLPAAMNSSKAEMFIGLLLRALKGDVNLKRASAFSKRLLQVALQQPPQYACGCLFLLSEVLKARPPLWNMLLQSESADEDNEHFEDIMEETENQQINPSNDATVPNSNEIVNSGSDDTSSQDEVESKSSYSEDNISDEADDLILKESLNEMKDAETPSNGEKPSLPGGYNPRHREPSYCNADRVSWWELMVLASHVHPSVATMARTLLAGVNIAYNGNPLTDLSLPAFLDKFMEKKPKPTLWHGGSQIEPAKKLEMNNHLIGAEILSLADEDVPPEDLVFHRFYVNKMNSSKKPKKKKKKKAAENEAALELYGVDGGDESENEEIENMLDSAALSVEPGDYEYDDLDQVANEDDDDLVGDVSDVDIDFSVDVAVNDSDDGPVDDDDDDNDDDNVNIGDADDGTDASDDDDGGVETWKRKWKSGGKTGASPFASLEDYEHLLDDEKSPAGKGSREKKNNKLQKKKRRLFD